MDQHAKETLKKALLEEHDLLVGELKNIATPDPKMRDDWDARLPKFEPSASGSHASLEEASDEVEEYETRLAAEHTLESRLLLVNRALERMGAETYGICKKCKREIPLERMRANPATEFDLEHAQ